MIQEKAFAVLLAGGSGERMGADLPKQFLKIGNRTVLEYALAPFQQHSRIESMILVVHPDHRERAEMLIKKNLFSKVKAVVAGGETRQESSYQGIMALKEEEKGHLLIHDVVRPFVTMDIIDSCLEALQKAKAVSMAVALSDTLLRAEGEEDLRVAAILERSLFWKAQTPQGFHLSLIREAHRLAAEDGMTGFTDDCGLILEYGLAEIHIVRGEERNMKITYPEDLELAKKLLHD